jgi:CheY-like chemotaxis protein
MAQILIVDDECVIATLLREALRRAGHAVVTASSGEEGLGKAAEFHPDLVISDVQMPGMSGFELVSRLNRLMPETSCILMSGNAFATPESSRKELATLRVVSILRKPFQMGVLLHEVSEALQTLQDHGNCSPESSAAAQQCA